MRLHAGISNLESQVCVRVQPTRSIPELKEPTRRAATLSRKSIQGQAVKACLLVLDLSKSVWPLPLASLCGRFGAAKPNQLDSNGELAGSGIGDRSDSTGKQDRYNPRRAPFGKRSSRRPIIVTEGSTCADDALPAGGVDATRLRSPAF